MVYHDDTLTGRVHIELDAVRPELDRPRERGHGVLDALARGAAVRDQLGPL
jgi:hypothetical protein